MAAAVMFQLPLTTTAQRVSDVYGGTPGQLPDQAIDIPYRWLVFQADADDVFIGDSTVAPTRYGMHLGWKTVTDSIGPIGPFGSGVVRLSDFWACGLAGAVLHILGLRF